MAEQSSLTATLRNVLLSRRVKVLSHTEAPVAPKCGHEVFPAPTPAAAAEAEQHKATLEYLEDMLLWTDEDDMRLHELLVYQTLHTELEAIVAKVEALSFPGMSLTTCGDGQMQVQEQEFGVPAREYPAAAEQNLTLAGVAQMLVECARAVVADDVETVNTLVSNLSRYATPYGSSLQRMTHYVLEALVAKLHGTGADLYAAIRNERPQGFHPQKIFQIMQSKLPAHAMAHQFTNCVFMDAFEGARSVHIISYGILNGRQWPSLMRALACRPGGAPRLRITGIEFPQPGLEPDEGLVATGHRLQEYANSLGLEFQFQGFAAKWEDVQVSSLGLQQDEVLAVCCIYRLRHLLDDSVLPSNPRMTVLERICSMNPMVFVTGFLNVAVNTPFLTSRVSELLPFANGVYEAYECTMHDLPEERLFLEKHTARDILNILACEGCERLERFEAYYQWHRRLQNAGFQIVPLEESWYVNAGQVLREYHENFTIGHDAGWIIGGWKETVLYAMAAWEPIPL